jgi:tetratricopeptide (TPR) repeat protein
MQPLEPPDTHFLSAAIGWMELGNMVEAEAELTRISPARQTHPDVLEARWLLYAEQQRWAEALQVARLLVQTAPKRPSGWLHQAYALRRAPDGSIAKAWEALLPAANRFPKQSIIPYNLACYAAQMQQLESARAWLRRALAIGDKEHIKALALADPDLEPLWPEVRKL